MLIVIPVMLIVMLVMLFVMPLKLTVFSVMSRILVNFVEDYCKKARKCAGK